MFGHVQVEMGHIRGGSSISGGGGVAEECGEEKCKARANRPQNDHNHQFPIGCMAVGDFWGLKYPDRNHDNHELELYLGYVPVSYQDERYLGR